MTAAMLFVRLIGDGHGLYSVILVAVAESFGAVETQFPPSAVSLASNS